MLQLVINIIRSFKGRSLGITATLHQGALVVERIHFFYVQWTSVVNW